MNLDSTPLVPRPIGGYRSLLVKDEALERRLAVPSRPVLRKVLVVAIPCLCAVMLYFGIAEQGLSQFFYFAFAVAILTSCLFRFRREHEILRRYADAVGTVLVRKKPGPRGRGGARIKYGFLSTDDKMHIGTVGGTPFLPKVGQTLPITYSLEDPSINLPRSSFWFYEFSPLK